MRNEIPLPRDLEQILLELGQIAGPAKRFGVHEKRRLDLDVAVLARMQIEHEVDQGACEAGAGPEEDREPRAGHLRGPLEVDDAERRTELPVRTRLEVERLRLAVPAHFLVVFGGGADRHARMRQVRERHEQRRLLKLDVVQLNLELTDLLIAHLVGGKNPRRIETLALGARDLVAGRVLLPFQSFELGDETFAARLERRQLLQVGIRVEAAVAQAGASFFEVIPHVRGVEHDG